MAEEDMELSQCDIDRRQLVTFAEPKLHLVERAWSITGRIVGRAFPETFLYLATTAELRWFPSGIPSYNHRYNPLIDVDPTTAGTGVQYCMQILKRT